MPNRTEARSAKAALTNATGRLPLLRLFSTLLIFPLCFFRRHEPPPQRNHDRAVPHSVSTRHRFRLTSTSAPRGPSQGS